MDAIDELFNWLAEADAQRAAKRRKPNLVKSIRPIHEYPKPKKATPIPRVVSVTASPAMMKSMNLKRFDLLKARFDASIAAGTIKGADIGLGETILNKAFENLANSGRI